MKKSKLILSTSLVLVLLFSVILFNSCDKSDTEYNSTTLLRPCDNVICLNGGTCKDGRCSCPLGYEGDKCTIKWSDRFTGQYAGSDECLPDSVSFYNVTITANPDFAYKMSISNLGTFCPNTILNAEINPEKTTFVIPMQNACGDLYLSGYGNQNGNYINVFLKSRDTILHTSSSCSILLSKK